MNRVHPTLLKADDSGQAMIEVAIAFPLLLIAALALLQFALFYHAENVVMGAAQDGARLAAEEDRSVDEGMAHTQALLRAGLGPSASNVRVTGAESGDMVAIEAQGRLRMIVPWVGDASLPLHARATLSKEAFRATPRR